MGLKRAFALGALFGFTAFIGCAGFAYRYYGLSEVIYERGILLGPHPKDDLPFSKCAPSSQVRNPCVIMFADEFFDFKKDYEDTKNKLKECEKRS